MPRTPKAVTVDRASIRRLRESQGLTQEEVALKAGVSRNRIGDIESGKPLAPETVKAIAEALGATYEEVVGQSAEAVRKSFLTIVQEAAKPLSPQELLKALPAVLSALGAGCVLLAFLPGCAYACIPAIVLSTLNLILVIRWRLTIRVHMAVFAASTIVVALWCTAPTSPNTLLTSDTERLSEGFSARIQEYDPRMGFLIIHASVPHLSNLERIGVQIASAFEDDDDILVADLHRVGEATIFGPVDVDASALLFGPLEPGAYELQFSKKSGVVQRIGILVNAKEDGGSHLDLMYHYSQMADLFFRRQRLYVVPRS